MAFLGVPLNRKTFAAGTRPRCVGVDKVESFAVQTAAEIQGGIAEVQEAFKVSDQLNSLIFKDLIHGLGLRIKIQVVRQPATAASDNGNADEEGVAQPGFVPQGFYFLFGLFADVKHTFSNKDTPRLSSCQR